MDKESTTIPNALYFEQVKAMLSLGKIVKIPLAGKSMLPFLKEGDVMALRSPDSSTVYQDKMVLANYNEGYVLHWVVRASGKFVFLAGSNNVAQIERVNKNEIIAVVLEAYRDGKPLYINRRSQVLKVWFWHQLRPLRYLYGKFFNRV